MDSFVSGWSKIAGTNNNGNNTFGPHDNCVVVEFIGSQATSSISGGSGSGSINSSSGSGSGNSSVIGSGSVDTVQQ